MHNTAAGAANTYGEEKYEGASITAEAATDEHECDVCAAICTVRQNILQCCDIRIIYRERKQPTKGN
jgi:Na+-translocating ferredoxin:NAD+ oxidoreductase RnfC subunit